jgi:hypothetical protein
MILSGPTAYSCLVQTASESEILTGCAAVEPDQHSFIPLVSTVTVDRNNDQALNLNADAAAA